jgi:hypothetical protein
MEKVRMEEVETMAVELLPDREEMQITTTTNTASVADSAGAGQVSAGNGAAVAIAQSN